MPPSYTSDKWECNHCKQRIPAGKALLLMRPHWDIPECAYCPEHRAEGEAEALRLEQEYEEREKA